MASIKKRIVQRKGTDKFEPRYDVAYREADGRRRKKTFRKLADAETFRTTTQADVLRGTYLDPDAGRITFEQYALDWLTSRGGAPTTRTQRELRLRVHVLPVLGSKPLATIKPSTIRAWSNALSGAASSRREVMKLVSSIMSSAVEDERIAKNPCSSRSVVTPRVESRRVVPWTTQRVLDVTTALPEGYRVATTIGAGLGLRQGEVFGLSPDDVDWLRGTVTVQRQVRLLSSNRQTFARPKYGKTRHVPLADSVRDVLAAHLATRPARRVELPWDELDGKLVAVPLILSTREGTALNRNYFNPFVWKKALLAAGVETTRDNGMHALRHFFASVLLDAGESIRAVSEYLGHSDPGFTLRTYTHLMPSSASRTRSAVDHVLSEHIGSTSGRALRA